MKKDIHPKYYPEAQVKCSCGNKITLGATKEKIEVEICSACHPFYTGDDTGKMRGSQVEKFKERMTKKLGRLPKSKSRPASPKIQRGKPRSASEKK